MNNIYLITTAIAQSHPSDPILNGSFCIMAATELEAAAIALTSQSESTYIFSIEVYLPERGLDTFEGRSRCNSRGRRKNHLYQQKISNE